MKRQQKSSKQNLPQQAVCPECWQTVQVHDNQTYFAHGKLRGVDQEPTWCSLSTQPIQPLFALGQCILTVGAIEVLRQARQDPDVLLKRHQYGNWGELPPEDMQASIFNVQHGYRILSGYTLKTGVKIRIVTQADRSATTLLLADEYGQGTGKYL